MNQIYCMAFGTLILLGVVVFTVGKNDVIRIRKGIIVSCGPNPLATEHNSWPMNDNGRNGCAHQFVNAAILVREKRGKMHNC